MALDSVGVVDVIDLESMISMRTSTRGATHNAYVGLLRTDPFIVED